MQPEGRAPGAGNGPGAAGERGAAPRGPAASFTILQFNMWGWIGYRGRDEIAHATAKTIREQLPAVVTLNEVCLGQLQTVGKDLEEEGIKYQFHHDYILHREDGAGSCDFGNAVMWLSDEPADREPEMYLSIPPKEQARKLLAVRVGCLRLPTVLCVTHLTSGRGAGMRRLRKKQAVQIAEYVRSWKDRGVEVILGGDFNEQPDSPVLDPMYLPAYGGESSGICYEATSREAPNPGVRTRPFLPTHRSGRKYDYVFMTTGYTPMGVRVTHSLSDHHPYYAFIH